MTDKDKFLELKVGIFVLIGLVVIAVMAFWFGKTGEQTRKSYSLTLHLPDANGILKGSDVQLAGARIGYVANKPRIAPNVSSVIVELKINDDVKIPRQTTFQVGSSGLLGDRFIQVSPTDEFKAEKFDPANTDQVWQPGETATGSEAGGLDEVTRKAPAVLDSLKEAIDNLKVTTTSINNGVLSEQNLKNLEQTFANLNKTSATFVEVSQNASKVIQDAQGAVDGARKTMVTADAAANDLRNAMGDARKVLDSAKELLRKASAGEGLIGTLLSDRRLADDIRSLAANLRQRGVLFYRDAQPRASEVKPQPQPQKRR